MQVLTSTPTRSSNLSNMSLQSPRPSQFSPRLLHHQHALALALAAAIVKGTPAGASALDRQAQIKQTLGLLDDTATNITGGAVQAQVDAPSQLSDATLIPAEPAAALKSFSPERPVSPLPRLGLNLKRSLQDVEEENIWRQRISQLEIENENLKRWRLDQELRMDQMRMEQTPPQCAAPPPTIEQPRRGNKKQKKSARSTINTQPIMTTTVGPLASTRGTFTAPPDHSEMLRVKSKLLTQLQILRRHRFYAETAGGRDGVLRDGFRTETTIWNATMTSSIVEIVQESTRSILSPQIDAQQAQAVYEHSMSIVQEHTALPILTFKQFLQIIEALQSSWYQLLQAVRTRSTAEAAVSDNWEAKAMSCLNVHCIRGYGDVTPQQQLYLGSLLQILLRDTLKQLEQSDPPRTRDQAVEWSQTNTFTRSSLKAKMTARLLRARKSLKDRHERRQFERHCGWLTEVAIKAVIEYCMPGVLLCTKSNMARDSAVLAKLKQLQEDCRGYISGISSFVLFAPATATGTPPSAWLVERLMVLLTSAERISEASRGLDQDNERLSG